jgi:membrane fusion protein (multidrug efflux system)
VADKRFNKTQIIIFLALVVFATSLWIGRNFVGGIFSDSYAASKTSKKKKKRLKRAVPVIVKPVAFARNAIRIEAIGTARAKKFVTLFPETAGEIMSFKLNAGDHVKKGQVILELDPKNAKLTKRMAETRLVEAKRLLSRSKQLRNQRVNSKANVQDALSVVERAEVELAQAREALVDRTIRAPFDGIVGIPKAEEGERVTPAMPIITIDNRKTLVVEFEIAERYLSTLSIGQKVSAKTPSSPDKDIEGTIESLDSRVDPISRSIRVRAAFANLNDTLRPGASFFVNLSLPGKKYPQVPQLALQWESGKSFVWRVKKRKAQKVLVRAINRLSTTVLVEGELSAGDLVVVEGVHRLRPGRKVIYKHLKTNQKKQK